MSEFGGSGKRGGRKGGGKPVDPHASTWDNWNAQGLPLSPIARKLAGGRIQDADWVVPRIQRHLQLHPEAPSGQVQRKEGGAASGAGGVTIPEGGGAPLPAPVRSKMQGKLGADLSDVKVHTGGDSAKASEDLNAKAFTTGTDVHFNAGEFDPSTKEGEKLLAHELTHVAQNKKGGVQRKSEEGPEVEGVDSELDVSEPDDPNELEADAKAEEIVEGEATDSPVGGDASPRASRKVQRTANAGAPAAPSGGAAAGGAAAGGAAAGGAAAAAADPPVPTALAVEAPGDIGKLPADLEADLTKPSGGSGQAQGGVGDAKQVTKQIVDTKPGAQMDGTTLSLPAITDAMLKGATSAGGIAQSVAQLTGVSSVEVKKDGADGDFSIDLSVNPKITKKVKAQTEWDTNVKNYTAWFTEAELISGKGALKAVPEGAKLRPFWSDNLVQSKRAPFHYRVKDHAGSYEAAQEADDYNAIKDEIKNNFKTIGDAWTADAADKNITRSDDPAAPKESTIMDGFAASAEYKTALQTGETDADAYIKGKLSTWWDAEPKFKPLVANDGKKAVTETGTIRTDYLKAASAAFLAAAKTYGGGKAVAPHLKNIVNAIRFEENGPTGKIVFQPWDLVDHTLYKPQGIVDATVTNGGATAIEYTGYNGTRFHAELRADQLIKSIEGFDLQEKIPGTAPNANRGVTESTMAEGVRQTPRGDLDAATDPANTQPQGAEEQAAAGHAVMDTERANAAAASPAHAGGDVPDFRSPATPAAMANESAARQNRTHLIGDRFQGSGYLAALNTITCSDQYNKVEMARAEVAIANTLKSLPNADPATELRFNLKVEVEWSAAMYPAIIEEIAKQSPGYNYAERIKQLEEYFANANRDIRYVTAVTYTLGGDYAMKDGTAGVVGPSPPPLGPDIYWGLNKK